MPPGAEGVTFLPYLQGERTPHRDASARGAVARAQPRAHARAPDAGGARRDLLRAARFALHPAGARPRAEPPAAHRRRREERIHPAAAGEMFGVAGDDGESRGRAGVRRGAARGRRRRRVPRSRGGGARDAYSRRRSERPDPQAHRDVRRQPYVRFRASYRARDRIPRRMADSAADAPHRANCALAPTAARLTGDRARDRRGRADDHAHRARRLAPRPAHGRDRQQLLELEHARCRPPRTRASSRSWRSARRW